MKTSINTTEINTNVILKAIDLELKSILVKDLEQFKSVRRNKQVPLKTAA